MGEDSFAVGMVLRNEHGEFVMGKNLRMAGQVTVMEAEAHGVYEALRWVDDLRLHQVVIESDSSLVVQALQLRSSYFLKVGNILEACQGMLEHRSDLIVHHVKRHANGVAHVLAKMPCLIDCHNIFVSPPHCVLESLSVDCSSA